MKTVPVEGLAEDWGAGAPGYLLQGLGVSLLVPQEAMVRICKRCLCAGGLLLNEHTST